MTHTIFTLNGKLHGVDGPRSLAAAIHSVFPKTSDCASLDDLANGRRQGAGIVIYAASPKTRMV